jgi:hypothetical protein
VGSGEGVRSVPCLGTAGWLFMASPTSFSSFTRRLLSLSLSHPSPSLPLSLGLTCILPELLKIVAETMPRPRQKRIRSIEPEPAPEFENWEELNETTKR